MRLSVASSACEVAVPQADSPATGPHGCRQRPPPPPSATASLVVCDLLFGCLQAGTLLAWRRCKMRCAASRWIQGPSCWTALVQRGLAGAAAATVPSRFSSAWRAAPPQAGYWPARMADACTFQVQDTLCMMCTCKCMFLSVLVQGRRRVRAHELAQRSALTAPELRGTGWRGRAGIAPATCCIPQHASCLPPACSV